MMQDKRSTARGAAHPRLFTSTGGNALAAEAGTKPNTSTVFKVRDCALVALATGRRAQTLRELSEGLRYVTPASIYHHFWGRLLRPIFDEPEYTNDFASWAFHDLHDKSLAERLSTVDPAEFENLEELRQELLDVVESRLDEKDVMSSTPADREFHFIRSKIIIFDTDLEAKVPRDLCELIPRMSSSSIFYHFIDARTRTDDKVDDFSAWIGGIDGSQNEALIHRIEAIDPLFSSLAELREHLGDVIHAHFCNGGQ